MKGILFFLSIFFINSIAFSAAKENHAVWNTIKDWNNSTEVDFQSWIVKNVSSDLFTNPENEFKAKLSVDCARATVAMRLLFAYQQGLRFVYRGNSSFYDSENDTSSDFLSFAQKVISDASTTSIQDNTFPVALSKKAVRPGVIYLFQMPSGSGDAGRHAYMIKNITKAGVPHFIWATVPARPRTLSERIEYPHFMVASARWDNQWGFRRFYQPKDYETRKQLDELSKKAGIIKSKKGKRTEQDIAQYEQILKDIESISNREWSSRGYSEVDQNKVTQEILAKYQEQYEKYLQEKGLSYNSIDFTGFKFRLSKIDQKKSEFYPALPVVTYEQVESTKEKVVASIGESPKNKTNISLLKIYHHMITHMLNSGLPEEPNHTMARYYKNLCFYIRERNVMIEEGYNFFFKNPYVNLNDKKVPIMSAPNEFNKCMSKDSKETYDYSTVNRDEDMRAFITDAKKWYVQNREKIIKGNYLLTPYFEVIFQDDPIVYNINDPSLKSLNEQQIKEINDKKIGQVQEMILKYPLSMNSSDNCSYVVDYHNGKSEILYPWEIRKRFETKNLVSSWPWVSIERRWGKSVPTSSEYSREEHPHCDTREVIKAKETALD